MLAKIILLAVWALSIVAWAMPWTGVLAGIVKALAPFMAVAHVIEFFVFREVFAKAGGSAPGHFVNTFFFGVGYINPLKEELEAREEQAAATAGD